MQLGGQRSDVFCLNDVLQGKSVHQRSGVTILAKSVLQRKSVHERVFWRIRESIFTWENRRFFTLFTSTELRVLQEFSRQYSSFLSDELRSSLPLDFMIWRHR